jgi:hypothetical protein
MRAGSVTTTAIVPVVACALLAAFAAVRPAAAEPARRLTVTAVQDRLSVEATDVGLGELLEEVGRAAGVVVVLDAALPAEAAARRVSVAFEGVTADDAFRRLLRDYHAVYRYGAANAGLQSVTVYGVVVPARSGLAGPPSEQDDLERQSEALRALAERSEPAARDAALEILGRAAQPELLADALDVLDGLEFVPAEPLLAFAGSARPSVLRGRALKVLVRHWPRDPRVAALIRAGTRDADEEVREIARALLDTLPAD